MTAPYRFLTSIAFALLFGGCGGDVSPPVEQAAPLTELPPPLAAGTSSRPTPPPVDRDDWQLPDAVPDPAPWFRLLYVQDNRGELEACGCPGAPTGGLARRATYGGLLRELLPDAVAVEGPNSLSRAVVGTEEIRGDHRARGRKVLELLARWQPEAFFPGQADLAVVPLREMTSLASFPVVASNLARAGAEGTKPWLRVERGGRVILLLGLIRPAVSESARQATDLRPAPEAVREILAEAGPVDLVVAFTDGSLRDLTTWFEAGLDVDVLLAPPGAGTDAKSAFRGTTWVARSQPSGRSVQRLDVVLNGPNRRGLDPRSPGSSGVEQVARQEEQYLELLLDHRRLQAAVAAGDDPREYVGEGGDRRLDPRSDPDRVRASLGELKALRARQMAQLAEAPRGHTVASLEMTVRADLAEDEAVVAALDAFGVRRLQEIEADLESASAPQSRYLGHEQCVDCHTGVQGHWARSAHARAWATLVERGEQRTPECLTCHSTGFGAPGGFADPDKARHLVGVQCEACHGPMELHVGQSQKPGFKADPGQPVTEATCTRCHDPVNSPRFDYSTYAPRVAHPGSRRSP